MDIGKTLRRHGSWAVVTQINCVTAFNRSQYCLSTAYVRKVYVHEAILSNSESPQLCHHVIFWLVSTLLRTLVTAPCCIGHSNQIPYRMVRRRVW